MKKIVLSSVLIMLISACSNETNVKKNAEIKSGSTINEVNIYSARKGYLLRPLLEEFEKDTLKKTTLFDKVEGTTISSHFGHIFGGGYAAGYYSYKWAEVLEADAFESFKENGIFNKEIALSFRENVLSKGNLKNPMELYKNFKGREPKVDALLKRDGLV